MNGLEYIRKTYAVPAKRGGRVRFTGGIVPQEGTITRASGPHIMIHFDGEKNSWPMHPTWEITYL